MRYFHFVTELLQQLMLLRPALVCMLWLSFGGFHGEGMERKDVMPKNVPIYKSLQDLRCKMGHMLPLAPWMARGAVWATREKRMGGGNPACGCTIRTWLPTGSTGPHTCLASRPGAVRLKTELYRRLSLGCSHGPGRELLVLMMANEGF